MGNLLDKLKDPASQIESAAKKIENAAVTKNHRKYVLNDFSIVEKARILILSIKDKNKTFMSDASDEFSVMYDLSVQVNPENFSFGYRRDVYSVLSGLKSASKESSFPKVAPGSGYDYYQNEIDIPLKFDIYDEYNARSANDAIPVQFSLADSKFTSLPHLVNCVKEGIYYAQFLWGDIKLFGFLNGINVIYLAFSKWGQPLKADATLSIIPQPLPYGMEANITDFESKNITTTGKKIVNGVLNIFR